MKDIKIYYTRVKSEHVIVLLEGNILEDSIELSKDKEYVLFDYENIIKEDIK